MNHICSFRRIWCPTSRILVSSAYSRARMRIPKYSSSISNPFFSSMGSSSILQEPCLVDINVTLNNGDENHFSKPSAVIVPSTNIWPIIPWLNIAYHTIIRWEWRVFSIAKCGFSLPKNSRNLVIDELIQMNVDLLKHAHKFPSWPAVNLEVLTSKLQTVLLYYVDASVMDCPLLQLVKWDKFMDVITTT